jgi:hypothetical protein
MCSPPLYAVNEETLQNYLFALSTKASPHLIRLTLFFPVLFLHVIYDLQIISYPGGQEFTVNSSRMRSLCDDQMEDPWGHVSNIGDPDVINVLAALSHAIAFETSSRSKGLNVRICLAKS